MSVNLYNKETKTLTQVAGAGGGVAKFGAPVENWLVGHYNAATAITADRDGILYYFNYNGSTETPLVATLVINGKSFRGTRTTGWSSTITLPIRKGDVVYAYDPLSGDQSMFYPFVENIVEPIEGGEEYSEEEQIVGVYCDGKPIYKLTVSGYSGNGGVSLFDYHIKYPLRIEGFAKKYGSDSSLTSLPTFGSNGEMASLAFNISGSGAEVVYRVKGFSYRHSDIDFTIWYTKTTD